ncbi:unnamed protein product [Caenorhabditis auriculariae]|uniref:cytochrome-b5 reductase n=1 Tax=Caenorhabditis auriculariae TaxID=2777116 RepID=A0A8S1HQX6_9PELO|nr:unnamed protein product [Caenorhabditis auriculariae]
MTKLITGWKVDDVIDWRGPYGVDECERIQKVSFKWNGWSHLEWLSVSRCAAFEKLILVAGGTGIAPFIRIVEDILIHDKDVIVRLVYCVPTVEQAIYREKMARWGQHWNVKIVLYVSKEGEHAEELPHLLKWKNNRLDEAGFSEEFNFFKSSSLEKIGIAVCGQATLEKDVMNWAKKIGVPGDNIIRFPP